MSGITADQIIITSAFGDNEPFDVGTLYHISNSYRLCLSENFTIGYASVEVAQAADNAIDFSSCLVRAE